MGLYTGDELTDIDSSGHGESARSASDALENARDITPSESESEEPDPLKMTPEEQEALSHDADNA